MRRKSSRPTADVCETNNVYFTPQAVGDDLKFMAMLPSILMQ